MSHILVVEDETAIAELISMTLELVGHRSSLATDGEQAIQIMDQKAVDLVLLDVMLPETDGFALLSQFQQRNIPVIFLTARSSVADKVHGLRLGADDYITKPFEAAELLARIEAVLRRTGRAAVTFSYQGVEVSLQERKVTVQGQPVELTAQEFNLLEVLIQNRNIALSREKLLEMAWGYNYVGESRTVDIHIQRLRKKLGWEDCLKTVFKYGYRLELQ